MAITLVTASHEAFGVILKAGFKCICMKQKAEMVSQRGMEGTGAAGRKSAGTQRHDKTAAAVNSGKSTKKRERVG